MELDERPVLIACDGSDHAKDAIEQAAEQLRTPREAVVVAVYEPLSAIPFWGVPAATVPTELIEEVRSQAAKVAEEGAELARSAGFDATSQVAEGVRTWQAILETAEKIDAGLIVLGSHGRGSVGSAVIGSVATAVAQHAHLPVMIYRPADGD